MQDEESKPRLEWRPQARSDLLGIVGDIAEHNPDAAQDLKDEIETKAAKLPDHPRLYQPSTRAKGMRDMVVRANYVLIYRESPELVEVVNVVHARRQYPVRKGKK